MINITIHIEKIKDDLYLGWTDQFKGLVEEGENVDDVIKEMMISVGVKLSYDYNIPMSSQDITCDRISQKNENLYEMSLA